VVVPTLGRLAGTCQGAVAVLTATHFKLCYSMLTISKMRSGKVSDKKSRNRMGDLMAGISALTSVVFDVVSL
jgi:hypothetical protein